MQIGNTHQPVATIHPPYTPEPQAELQDNRRRAMRACFAILNNLDLAPITTDDVWAYFKSQFQNWTRSEWTERQFVVLEAKLRACSESAQLKTNLINTIADWKPQGGEFIPTFQRAYVWRIESDRCVLVNDDEYTPRIHERCQKHANATGCSIRLEYLSKVEMYYPHRDRYENTDVDGQISSATFYNTKGKRQIDITFNGKSKVYTYDKLGKYDVALCEVFAQHGEFDKFYYHINQIRLKYESYLDGTLPAACPPPADMEITPDITTDYSFDCYICNDAPEQIDGLCKQCDATEKQFDDAQDALDTAVLRLRKVRSGKTEHLKRVKQELEIALKIVNSL